MAKTVIIGNGISGVTLARHVRKNSDQEIVLISGESDYFFSRTALMYVFMGHMRWNDIKPYEDGFWKKNRIQLENEWVTSIDYANKKLSTKSGKQISYDNLVLALGSKPTQYGWPGQDLKAVQGLYSKQDLESINEQASAIKTAVIVGGGLIGVELAEMLLSRGIGVTFLVREKAFWNNVLPIQEAILISKHIRKHHVDLRFETELAEIIDDGHGRVGSVLTKNGEKIQCEFVGLTTGVTPNIDFVRNTELETKNGILINRFFETNIPDVYSIGDCAQFSEPVTGRRAVEQVWYTGRIMGETLAQTLCGRRTEYNPGPWFNSAKFFDIEYQTYGNVNPVLAENESEYYWESILGDKCIHVVWDTKTDVFKGINVFGIRMRHELFDTWLRRNESVEFVIANLRVANFDPELYARHENEIVQSFNQTTNKHVVLTPKTWWRNLINLQ